MTVTHRIFLDDERFPVDESLTVVRTYWELKTLLFDISDDGELVSFISFDHDLGTPLNGKHCAEIFEELYWKGMDILADDFTFDVHSQNPIGAKNIKLYMENFLKHTKQGSYRDNSDIDEEPGS